MQIACCRRMTPAIICILRRLATAPWVTPFLLLFFDHKHYETLAPAIDSASLLRSDVAANPHASRRRHKTPPTAARSLAATPPEPSRQHPAGVPGERSLLAGVGS